MGGFHHHHHHHPGRRGMGRPLLGPAVGVGVGVGLAAGPRGGRGGCIVCFVIGAVILIAAIITLVVVFAVDATCPSNVMKCKECTSWMNVTGHPRNDTNATVWHIEEICWEDLQWSNLTERQQTLWGELGQTQTTWDNDIQSARALNLCWDELDSTELTAATALGYRRETWDWGGGCGIDTFYYTVYYYSPYYYYSGYYYYYSSYYYYYY